MRRRSEQREPAVRQYGVVMSRNFYLLLAGCCSVLFGGVRAGAAAAGARIELQRTDVSFRNEVQRAIDRGIVWLREHQNTNGSWSTPDQPAVTALALAACHFSFQPDRSAACWITSCKPELL